MGLIWPQSNFPTLVLGAQVREVKDKVPAPVGLVGGDGEDGEGLSEDVTG